MTPRLPSADFWQKLWNVNFFAIKSCLKICISESTLNCRSHHSLMKLTHQWCGKLSRNPDWSIVMTKYVCMCVYMTHWMLDLRSTRDCIKLERKKSYGFRFHDHGGNEMLFSGCNHMLSIHMLSIWTQYIMFLWRMPSCWNFWTLLSCNGILKKFEKQYGIQ